MRYIKLVSVQMLLALLLSITLATGQKPVSALPTEEELQTVLRQYSTSLATGRVASEAQYSPALMDLLRERRKFYAEVFTEGLHSDLLSLESDFDVESITGTDGQGDLHTVQAVEMVTLRGKYQCSSPDEYPLVKAGRWALANTDDPAVRKAIEGYIESMVEGIAQSISEESFETVFVVRHELLMAEAEEGLKILQDSFTDEANDNPAGYDNVSWVNGGFVRREPDLTLMPDYMIYHTPVEELGRSLLETYSRAYGGHGTLAPQYHYYHSVAANYINAWVKATTSTCQASPPVYQNQSNWNPSYPKIWCDDCANYVSQALKWGGCTTTDEWNWNPMTLAWRYVPKLKSFLLNNGRGVMAGSLSDLQAGDIAFKADLHVAMVAAVGPHRYSAHTSDRRYAGWWADLNQYMKMIVEPPIIP